MTGPAQAPPPTRREIVDAVRGLAADSPYAVTATERGFDVGLDLADSRWWTSLERRGLKVVHGHQVTLDLERRRFVITDDLRQIDWHAGPGAAQPYFTGSAKRVRGRVIEMGTHQAWGLREDGTIGKVVDFTFDTREAHRLIRTAVAPFDLTERLPWEARVGLYVGVGTLIGAVLMGIVLIVLALLGELPAS